jgi:DNA phosphorothioation-dependent restriction protein DptG
MTIRGNYHIYFSSLVVLGLFFYIASQHMSINTLGIVLLLISQPLYFLIYHKHKPDEREQALNNKIDSYGLAFTVVIAFTIYMLFPQVNWFIALISGIYIAKGLIGLLIFSLE